MGNVEEKEQSEKRVMDVNDIQAVGPLPSENQSATTLWSQAGGETQATYGAEAPASSFVYALGRVEPRYPNLAIEKEYNQVVQNTPNIANLTEKQLLHLILSHPDNRYLARKMCWVLTIRGIDHYILRLRDPADLEQLVRAIDPRAIIDVDAVIGVRGPLAVPEMCNGLILPIVIADKIYSFGVDELVTAAQNKSLRKAGQRITRQAAQQIARRFGPASRDLFERVLRMTDNAGAADEHRALNYLAVRHEDVYERVVNAHAQNSSLIAIDTRLSRLSSTRRVVDVIFSFTDRQTGVVEKFFAQVDVTEEFPFLVTPLSQYYDH